MSNHRNRKRAIELLERIVNISPDQEIKLSREDIWAIRIGLDSLKLDEVCGLEYINYDLEYSG